MSGWREMAALVRSAEPGEGASAPEVDAPIAEDQRLVDLHRGLAKLKGMRCPDISNSTRWKQIIADAETVVSKWGHQLVELGWTLRDLFGIDLTGDTEALGLIFHIRGDDLVLVDARSAIVRASDKRTHRIHYRWDNPPPPIWLAVRR